MIDIINKDNCCGCKACQQICPKNCISMQIDNEGFWYPKVNLLDCIDCGLCEKVCPELAEKKPSEPLATYASYNTEEGIRINSSSGGVFTLLAKEVIEQGGVVFGAKFDKEWNVVHSYVHQVCELGCFRGSKYVQSDINDSYSQARDFLKEGRLVLFTGTPCQISGLNLFLRKDYSNLLTMDFICHGVPSPRVWSDYLDNVVKDKSSISEISFRNKDKGWKLFSLKVQTNTKKISETLNKNLFLKGFLQDIYLRPSCYSCTSKKFTSGSDITVGDFWGIQNELPEIDDDKGVSCVFINSTKGKAFYDKLENLQSYSISRSRIEKYNPAIYKSIVKPMKRKTFFSSYDRANLLCYLENQTKAPFLLSLKNRLKYILKIVLIKLGCFEPLKRLYGK